MHAGKQFEQLALPGMEKVKHTPKEPHQMTPGEFMTHPDTYYHSSPQNAPFQGYIAKNGMFTDESTHAGTEHAALSLARNRTDRTGPVHMHAVHIPYEDFGNDEYSPISDDEAQQSPSDPMFYENEHEDPSAYSVVANQDRLFTHNDYVAKAVAEGRSHEVNPTVLHLYNKGKLNVPYATYGKDQVEALTTSDRVKRFNAHQGGLFPFKVRKWNDTGAWTPATQDESDEVKSEEFLHKNFGLTPTREVAPAKATDGDELVGPGSTAENIRVSRKLAEGTNSRKPTSFWYDRDQQEKQQDT